MWRFMQKLTKDELSSGRLELLKARDWITEVIY